MADQFGFTYLGGQQQQGGDDGFDPLQRPTSPLPNYYELLGIDKAATASDIKKAFARELKKTHSDKNHDDPKRGDRIAQALLDARKVLMDDKERRKYNRMLPQVNADYRLKHQMHKGDLREYRKAMLAESARENAEWEQSSAFGAAMEQQINEGHAAWVSKSAGYGPAGTSVPPPMAQPAPPPMAQPAPPPSQSSSRRESPKKQNDKAQTWAPSQDTTTDSSNWEHIRMRRFADRKDRRDAGETSYAAKPSLRERFFRPDPKPKRKEKEHYTPPPPPPETAYPQDPYADYDYNSGHHAQEPKSHKDRHSKSKARHGQERDRDTRSRFSDEHSDARSAFTDSSDERGRGRSRGRDQGRPYKHRDPTPIRVDVPPVVPDVPPESYYVPPTDPYYVPPTDPYYVPPEDPYVRKSTKSSKSTKYKRPHSAHPTGVSGNYDFLGSEHSRYAGTTFIPTDTFVSTRPHASNSGKSRLSSRVRDHFSSSKRDDSKARKIKVTYVSPDDILQPAWTMPMPSSHGHGHGHSSSSHHTSRHDKKRDSTPRPPSSWRFSVPSRSYTAAETTTSGSYSTPHWSSSASSAMPATTTGAGYSYPPLSKSHTSHKTYRGSHDGGGHEWSSGTSTKFRSASVDGRTKKGGKSLFTKISWSSRQPSLRLAGYDASGLPYYEYVY